MPYFTGRFPWQVSVLLTTLVYLAAALGLWQVPCEVGLLVGLCKLSRLVFFAIGLIVYLAFLGIAFGQRFLVRRETASGGAGEQFNRRMFFQMLFFCLLVAAFYVSVLFDKP